MQDLTLVAADDVHPASNLYEKNTVQLANCLIAVRNQQGKCKMTYTFDRKASKLEGFHQV